jgi:hypothetical protein
MVDGQHCGVVFAAAAATLQTVDTTGEMMQITLSDAQVNRLHDFVATINLAHLHEDCEPPGFSVVILFGGPYGQFAEGTCGGQRIALGPVQVFPEQPHWAPTVAGLKRPAPATPRSG